MNVMQISGWHNATFPAPLARSATQRSDIPRNAGPPNIDPDFAGRCSRATRWTPPHPSILAGRVGRRTPFAMLRGELLFSQVLSGRAERSVELAQDMTSRCRRVPLLAATLRAAAVREISLRQDLDAFTRPGYRLFALNLATGQEFHLGFLPAEGPLTLSNVALADGDYEIRLRSDGGYWCDARHATAFPLSIQDGEVVAPLPPITNLRYTRVGDAILLSWTWHPTPGMQTPRDFAIWTSPSQPVDITGEPDHVVPVLHPGGYSTTLPGTPPFHAAIRSRRDDRAGPVATITIHAPSPPPASPKNQTARFDRQ